MQPQCPNGHAYDAYHVSGFAQRVNVGGSMIRVAPIYCNQCGHVYGVTSAPD